VGDATRSCLVAGSELEGRDGPGDTPIFVWDSRNLQKSQHIYTESHTDTVTELKFHPSKPSLLLTASTDSLVNLIDVTNADEDEAVYQVINHRSAVHHAGFLSERAIYALGTDENLSFYQIQSDDPNVTEPDPVALGDIRSRLRVEYIVDIVQDNSDYLVAAGSHRYLQP
jgi:WD repeat-containing protein 89